MLVGGKTVGHLDMEMQVNRAACIDSCVYPNPMVLLDDHARMIKSLLFIVFQGIDVRKVLHS